MSPVAYYILKDEALAELFARARADFDVVAKTRDANGNLRYAVATDFEEVAFVEEQPTLSAKAVALPQNEALVRYERVGEKSTAAAATPPSRALLLFGVNMCDAAAFDIIDRVFKWDYFDDPYLSRRELTTTFALACQNLQRDCFCNRLQYAEEGVDVVVYGRAGGYLVAAQTEKGVAFIEKYNGLFAAYDGDAEEELASFAAQAGTVKEPPLLEDAKAGLEAAFEHAAWRELVSTCIGCGICTYVCPTCHCFDVQDEGGASRGVRLRTWDHCTGRTFTAMPAHQPRDRQYKRYRQRLLHKFWYYPERFGPLLCTGCGRCITQCPVKINIKELVEYFGGLRDTPPGGARGPK